MEWTNVKEKLPNAGSYLCLVKYFETFGGDGMSYTSPIRLIIECFFDPCKGWKVPHIKDDVDVLYWMAKPDEPIPKHNEKEHSKDQ